jgi:hypothetical protein
MHFLLLPLLMSLGDVPATPPADIAVVCPTDFRGALQPWLQRRQQQGHVIDFISNDGNSLQIRERIRTAAKNGTLQFVLLVGDAPPREADDAQRARCTPTFRLPSKIDRYWGGEPDFASDNPYADLDNDGVPELAIGRLTAHTTDELTVMIKKILAYEDSRDFGPWRVRINFVTGEGGFGPLVDATLEVAVRNAIGCNLPVAYQSTLTDALWRSPFCPDPHQFHRCTLERMNEGCLFWVFMGHGSPRTLQWAMFPDGSTPILQCEDCSQLRCSTAPPIALCMCCYTGAFAEKNDCLAEELLRAPGGPVAVFSGSNVTMPYGMAALGRQAVHAYFDRRSETLGQWLLQAKRDTMTGYDLPIWSLLHAATVAVAPAGFDLKEERREHLQLFNLFGDPTMRLAHPQDVKISAPVTAVAGQSIAVHAECSIAGSATVELLTPLDQLQVPSRDRYNGSTAGREQFDAVYRAANNTRLASVNAESKDGAVVAKLPVPAEAAGKCCLRVFVEGSGDFAVGGCRIQIVPVASASDNSAEAAVAGRPTEMRSTQ